MALRRRSASEALNPWPGYVDALSTLLMVIIFVLLVFVLAQAFLSVALSGRDRALDRLNRQMAELSDMLSLERGRTAELQVSVAGLNNDLASAGTARATLEQQLAALHGSQETLASERDALRAQRDQLAARLTDAGIQLQSGQARRALLDAQIAETAKQDDALAMAAGATAAQLAAARTQLAELQRQAALNDKTVQADRATIAAKLSDLAKLDQQVQALTALRDELEKQAQAAGVQATTEAQRRAAAEALLADEKRLGDSARAQLALLSQQAEQLRTQLAGLAAALDASEKSATGKDVQIADLGTRLNAALAQRVEELQRYRSEFFGRLRAVLANRPGIQVVGDRFVFQSEVLFPVGSADLTQAGGEQIAQLAETLKQVETEIPKDVNWLLRVDGHADRQPLGRGRFASNWELSAARAITVVRLLIVAGIAPERLAATGFADYQPLDPADTPDAYAKNRRIEIRLTDR